MWATAQAEFRLSAGWSCQEMAAAPGVEMTPGAVLRSEQAQPACAMRSANAAAAPAARLPLWTMYVLAVNAGSVCPSASETAARSPPLRSRVVVANVRRRACVPSGSFQGAWRATA